MPSRRGFVGGLLAAGMTPRLSWADAGAPAFLSAARQADGSFALAGVSADGRVLFRLPLPGRGHAATAHPKRPEAVAFARRPGTFALVLDCAKGTEIARLKAPEGRHFYGHGVFSSSGQILYTAENDYAQGRGVIGVWAARSGYRRVGEFASGGVGPHDIRLLPDQETLVIANGGIETHPESGRSKLNIPVMAPNLSYATLRGEVVERVRLPQAWHKNSIRHLAVSKGGTVAFAMQWQGDVGEHPPLLGLHRRGESIRLLTAGADEQARMKGYAGSVAISGDGGEVAISSPRGGLVHVFAIGSGALSGVVEMADVCGLGPARGGFCVSAGTGDFGVISGGVLQRTASHEVQWDNHLVAV
ncbi:DUF1513 domain-containing protein [Rhodobacteraceae bacterium D3-12]|nr:DUF1513 domain-containing protein [Rhodobacteraceae bacterium D3-12]